MRTVVVAGIGKTPFGAFADRDLRSLAVEAGQKCLANANMQPDQVEAFYLGNFAGPSFVGQNHLAPFVSTALGMTGIPSTRVEGACASSGSAFFHAVQSVAAGLYDIAMVVGVEKMTSQPTSRVTGILAAAGDTTGEVRAGSTFPSLFAMIARRHMHEFGTTREHLAAVAVKNHRNGALNPDAQMRKVITIEQALAGKPVADPLTLYDCSLISDGAAAVIVTTAERQVSSPRSQSVSWESLKLPITSRSIRSQISQPSLRCVRRRGKRIRRRALHPPTLSLPNCTTASPSPRL